MIGTPERRAAITGIGMSDVARRSPKTPLELTLDACAAAMAFAGLERSEIDGITTYPGANDEDPSGFSAVNLHEVRMAFDLKLNWFNAVRECPSQLGAIFNAVAAVAAGMARHVLVFRTICNSPRSGTVPSPLEPTIRHGVPSWLAPYNADPAISCFAMIAARHFHEFGTRPEDFGQIALNGRRNAALNPKAVYRTPMTLDDYMKARMISTPLRLFDCDVPVDSSVAFIVSSVDAARSMRNPVVRFEAIGTSLHSRDTWYAPADLTKTACFDAAAAMWSRTTLKPADMQFAQLYDGFAIQTLHWIEALGFCGRGEGGPFLENGARIALSGEIPINTGGGQLSAGRQHGFGHLYEACVQLWALGGERQLEPRPEVGVVGVGDQAFSGCAVLVRE